MKKTLLAVAAALALVAIPMTSLPAAAAPAPDSVLPAPNEGLLPIPLPERGNDAAPAARGTVDTKAATMSVTPTTITRGLYNRRYTMRLKISHLNPAKQYVLKLNSSQQGTAESDPFSPTPEGLYMYEKTIDETSEISRESWNLRLAGTEVYTLREKGSKSVLASKTVTFEPDDGSPEPPPSSLPEAKPTVYMSPARVTRAMINQTMVYSTGAHHLTPKKRYVFKFLRDGGKLSEGLDFLPDGEGSYAMTSTFPSLGISREEWNRRYAGKARILLTEKDSDTVLASAPFEYVYDDGKAEPTPTPTATTTPSPSHTATASPTATSTGTVDPTPTASPTRRQEPALTAHPSRVSAADFVNPKKGVTLTAAHCTPGQSVKFSVAPKDSDVTPLTRTARADDRGAAAWNVYGTNPSSPSAYIGDYVVTATCGGVKLSTAFSVGRNPQPGDDGDDGNHGGNDDGRDDSNGSLPRTGMELGGLGVGAALLLVGGATVIFTRRSRR